MSQLNQINIRRFAFVGLLFFCLGFLGVNQFINGFQVFTWSSFLIFLLLFYSLNKAYQQKSIIKMILIQIISFLSGVAIVLLYKHIHMHMNSALFLGVLAIIWAAFTYSGYLLGIRMIKLGDICNSKLFKISGRIWKIDSIIKLWLLLISPLLILMTAFILSGGGRLLIAGAIMFAFVLGMMPMILFFIGCAINKNLANHGEHFDIKENKICP